MKCPTCVANNERSKVTSEGGSATLMGWERYWDEDGVYHSHDPNQHSEGYHCARGHRWFRRYRTPCPAGDSPGEEELTTVEGEVRA